MKMAVVVTITGGERDGNCDANVACLPCSLHLLKGDTVNIDQLAVYFARWINA